MVREQGWVWQLAVALLQAREWREIGYTLAEHLKVLVPFDRLTFALVDPQSALAEVLIAEGEVEGLPRTGNLVPLEGTATGWVVRHRVPLFETEGQYQTPQFEQALKAGFRSRFAMPVEVDGTILAVLIFHSRQPMAYTEEHAQRLRPIIPLVALVLQRLLERWVLEEALQRLQLLRHLDNLLVSGKPMPQVLQGFAEALRSFIPFDRLSLSIYDAASNREWLYVAWHDGATWEAHEVLPFMPFGAAKKVMKTGEPLLRPRLDAAEFPAEEWLICQGFRSALVYPLPMKGNIKATLNFACRQEEGFTVAHLSFLQEIAEQVALALHALLAEEAERERENRLFHLLTASTKLLAARSVDEVVQVIDESLRKLELTPHVSLFIRFPDGIVQEAISTPQGMEWQVPKWLPQPLQPGETVLGDVLLGLRAIFVSNDPLSDISELERRQWMQVLGGQAFPFGNAIVPLQGHEGIVGAIAVDFRETRRFLSLHDELVQMLVMLGNLAGLALENLWLQEQREEQLKEVGLINDLLIAAALQADWRQISQRLVDALPQVVPCDTASVLLVTDDQTHLEFVATYPTPPPNFPIGIKVPITLGIMGYVAQTGQPILEGDVRTNPHYFPGRPGTLSELCVPIWVGGKVVGVINLEAQRLHAFKIEHLSFLQTLAAQLGMVIERAQLLHRQSKLAQQLSAIFESVQEGIALVLTDGRLDDVNRRFGDLIGIPADQLRGQPVTMLKDALLRRAYDANAVRDAVDAALSELSQPQYDSLLLTQPEQLLERYCVPVRLEDGTLMGQLWVLRDVTEEYRRHQESLRLERLRTLGELASGIAHDLNNALAPLLGSAELLRQHPDQEVKTLAETMLQAVNYAVGVVRRLQAFYRATAAPAPMTVDLRTILQDAIALTQSRWRDEALAEGVQIHVETHFPGEMPVRGDPTELRQAFINILLNAADAIVERAKATGNRQGTISIAMKQSGDQAMVQITDDGIGMTKEVRQRVFETFFTTKGERGSGLGMSMALAAVLVHGGRIHLDSEPLKGTTVTVTLPLHTPPTPPVATETATKVSLPRRRVLVVEDQAPVLQTVASQLQRLGQQVLTALDGSTALDILRQEKVDLLVTDLSMPTMNGLELARRVRELYPSLPIILMTGWGEIIPQEDLSAFGIQCLLTKPVSLQAWRDALLKVAGIVPNFSAP